MTDKRAVVGDIVTPAGPTSFNCDHMVVVAFSFSQGQGAQRRTVYTVWQSGPDRHVMLNAAKALLAKLAEDQRDAAGKAAARALERIHRKL